MLDFQDSSPNLAGRHSMGRSPGTASRVGFRGFPHCPPALRVKLKWGFKCCFFTDFVPKEIPKWSTMGIFNRFFWGGGEESRQSM